MTAAICPPESTNKPTNINNPDTSAIAWLSGDGLADNNAEELDAFIEGLGAVGAPH